MAVSEEAGLGESEPFHLNIEVLNKSEILNKKVGNWWYMGGGMLANSMVSDEKFSATVSDKLIEMIPKSVAEKTNMQFTAESVSIDGCRFVIKFQIMEIDFGRLMEIAMEKTPEEGEEINMLLTQRMPQCLKIIGQVEKAEMITEQIKTKVRNKMMEKLLTLIPDQMREQDVEMTLEIPEYTGELEEEPPEEIPNLIALTKPFYLKVSNIDRKKLLDEKIGTGFGSRVKKFAANRISDEKFNGKVSEKLSTEIPAKLKEAGFSVEAERMKEREKEENCICVKFAITDYDLWGLISNAKGEEFGLSLKTMYATLLRLSEHGFPMKEKADGIIANIGNVIRGSVTEKLTQALSETLHADVKTEDEEAEN